MSKFKTVVLHFGTDKTGSSSIQHACDTFRNLLEEHGVYYPSSTWHNELASCVSVDPRNEIANRIHGYTNIDWIKKRDVEYLSNLCNEIYKKEGNYLVFSNENFIFLDKIAMRNLYEFALQFGDECKILIYVRSPESYAIAGSSQRVKMGFLPWDPLPIANIYHALNSLEEICGKDRIIIRLFDKQTLYNGDVTSDFLSLFKLNSSLIESISKNIPQKNFSLSLEAQIIGEKIIHKLSEQKLTSLTFMKSFQRILESIKGQKIQLTHQQANEIKEATKIQIQYLKSKFDIIFLESQQRYLEPNDIKISDRTAESIAQILIDLTIPELIKSKNKNISSLELQLRHATLKEGYDIVCGQVICFEVEIALDRNITELEAGIHILDMQNKWAFGTNSTLQEKVMRDVTPGIYQVNHYVTANLPEGVYSVGFTFTEKLQDKSSNVLMCYDKLCEFRVSHPSERVGVGYANLPATQILTQIAPLVKNRITSGMGKIVCKTIISTVKVSEYIDLEVEIFNNTDVTWKGNVFRPINLSYHWFDTEDNPLIFDGCRTPIPNDGIAPNEPRVIRMRVMTPAQPGVYRLMLTMVQESSAWLETIGFQPFLVDIAIE